MKSLLLIASLMISASTYAKHGRHHQRMEMSVENKAAFEACKTELGLKRPEKGSRPTKEERKSFRECLSSKGVVMPKKGENGPLRPTKKEARQVQKDLQ